MNGEKLTKYRTKEIFKTLKKIKVNFFDEETYRKREFYDELLFDVFSHEFKNTNYLENLKNFSKKEAKGVAKYLIDMYEIKPETIKKEIEQNIINQGLIEYEQLKKNGEIKYKSCLAFILDQNVLNSKELQKINFNVKKYIRKNLISDLTERIYDFVLEPCVVNERKLFSKNYFK